MKSSVVFAVLVAAVCSTVGCSEPKSFLVHRPEQPKVDAAVTAMWTREVHQAAQDGDWILSRSYYAVADAISIATPGEDLSHASIYDARRDTVIEAIGAGVREIPLSQLIERNHYVIVVRPSGLTANERRQSVERARTQIGVEFDVGGLIGLDDPDKFYCSELVYWAAQMEARTGDHHVVVAPSDLMKYGEVIYWSGNRTDPQVMALATSSPRSTTTRTAAAAR
jgi:hypothetical protein